MLEKKRAIFILALACAVHLTTGNGAVTADPDTPQRPNLGPGENNWIPRKASPEGDRVLSLPTVDLCSGSGLTAQMLAEALLGSGPNAPFISNVTFTGACEAAGTFSGGAGILGFDSGIVLSSGNVAFATGPNLVCDVTQNNNLPGDSDLDGLIPGYATYDATVLEFDFECPITQTISFNYVFASEEYNEFVDSEYNDVFGFFLNGVNVALLPDNVTTVAINNVNCGFADCGSPASGGTNCSYYRDNDCSLDSACVADTEMDGLTVVLTIEATVQPGVNHIKLAIADAGDNILDSNVFIQGGSFLCACSDNVGPESVILSASGSCQGDPDDPTTACTTLEWTEPSDPTKTQVGNDCVDDTGSAFSYDLRWSTSPILTDADFAAANQVADEPTPGAPGGVASMQVCGLPEGTVYFAIRSSDDANNFSDVVAIEVSCVLNTPPVCDLALASISRLWPPNHKMVPVSILGVTDPDGDPVTITITGVTQDEPINDLGDGDTCPDAVLDGSDLELRAERSGLGNGRVYEVSFTAEDGQGGACEGTVRVCVPHDRSQETDCVDDGQTVDSMGPCAPGQPTPRLVAGDGDPMVRFVRGGSNGPKIQYSLSEDAFVRLEIFDVRGRHVSTLVEERQLAGDHWATWNTSGMASGLYFASVQVGNRVQTISLPLVK